MTDAPIPVQVVGLKHHGFAMVSADIHAGTELLFEREPANPHDANAIAVFLSIRGGRTRLGYVGKTYAAEVAHLIDAGRAMALRVCDKPSEKASIIRTEFVLAKTPASTPKRPKGGRDRINVWL